MDYKKHIPADIDLSILSHLTEDQVVAWIVARFHQIRRTSIPAESIRIAIYRRAFRREDPYYDSQWTIHGTGKCEDGETLDEALTELRITLGNNPRAKAEEKRREARRAIQEAEELETLASTLESPPPN